MPLCSIALPEPTVCCWSFFFLRYCPPRLFSQLRLRKQLSVCEDGLQPAFARRGHCWSHFPYFGEKVVYASFLLYDFSGSRGQAEGGFGQHRVGLRVTLPFHVLRLLRCVLVASLQGPCGSGAVGRGTLKYLVSPVFFFPSVFCARAFLACLLSGSSCFFGFSVEMPPVASFSLCIIRGFQRRASASSDCVRTEGRGPKGVHLKPSLCQVDT